MVQHRVCVDKSIGGRWTGEGYGGLGLATVTGGEGHAECSAGLEAGSRLAERDGTGLMDRPQLLRVTLKVTAHEREVLVDPDEDAAAVELLAVTTAHDDEGLLVLRAHRVEQFRAVIAATLPVGPDERDRTRVLVLVGERHAVGQQARDRRGIGAVLDGEQIARIVPRHGWQE